MPLQDHSSLPADLSSKLFRLEQRVRRLALLRGFGRLAVVVSVGLAGGMLVDFVGEVGVPVRIGLLGLVAGCAAFVVWRNFLRPAVRQLSSAELAALIEEAHPELHERLTSTVELGDPDVPEAHKGSALMRQMLTRQTVRSVAGMDFGESVSAAPCLRCGLWGAVAVAVLLVPFVFAPSAYGLLWTRFLLPWGNFDRVSPLEFLVENGNRVVARGSDVTIKVGPRWRSAPGELPKTVRLDRTDSAGQTDSRRLEFDEQAGAWLTTIPHVLSPFAYHISAERTHNIGLPLSRSKRYRIDVVDPPEIVRASLEIQPPAYTGRPADVNDGVVGEIPVFGGSRLTFALEFSKPVQQAELAWLESAAAVPTSRPNAQPNDSIDSAHSVFPPSQKGPRGVSHRTDSKQTSPTFVLADDGRSATLELTASVFDRTSPTPGEPTAVRAPFAFRLTDKYELHNSEEPNRMLVVTPDAPPRLELSGSDEPHRVRPDDVLTLSATATDDVGVGAFELHYEVSQGGKTVVPVEHGKLGGEVVSHEFQLSMADLGLSPGDVLTYRMRAADERPVPGPQEVWSKPRALMVSPSAEPLGAAELAELQESLKEQLEAVRADVAQNRNQVADLQQQADKDADAQQDFGRGSEVPPLSEQQMELARRLETLARRFAEHPLLAGLTPQAQQIARQDLAEARDHLRASSEKPIREKAAQLKEAVDRLSSAESKLDDMLKQFDQLAEIEQDLQELQRLARQAEKLADQARTLQQQSHAPADDQIAQPQQDRAEQIAEDQGRIEDDRQQLAKQLDDLLQRRPELIDAARNAHLDRLASLSRQLEGLAQPQESLADALRNESQYAAEQAASLSKQQEELLGQAQKLATDEDQPKSSGAAVDADTLQQALDELQAGNLQAAADRQQQAAQQLEQLVQRLQQDSQASPETKLRAEQLDQLAKRQQRLREQVAALSQERRPSPFPQSEELGARAPRPSQSQQNAVPQQADASTPNASSPEAASLPNARQSQAQQEQLVRDAAELALDVARQQGPESSAAKQAAELARLCGG